MGLPSAPAQLSPPASALPLGQWAHAWNRFTAATLIYVAMRPWWRRRRVGGETSHPTHEVAHSDLWFVPGARSLGRQPSEINASSRQLTLGRNLRTLQDVCCLHSLLRWSQLWEDGYRTRTTRKRRSDGRLIQQRTSLPNPLLLFGAIEALLVRTALAGAFPHAPHMLSSRAVAALRAQHSRRWLARAIANSLYTRQRIAAIVALFFLMTHSQKISRVTELRSIFILHTES